MRRGSGSDRRAQLKFRAWVNNMLGTDSKGATAVMTSERTSSGGKPKTMIKPASNPVPEVPDAVSVQDNLILGHMALVRRLAAKFRYSGEPLEDLIQVGNLGLVKAAQNSMETGERLSPPSRFR